MTNLVSIGKKTAQQDVKEAMLRITRNLVDRIESGEVIAFFTMAINPDRQFAVWQSGDIHRIEAIGLIEQAKHDLLNDRGDT